MIIKPNRARSPAWRGDSGFFRDIGERPVAIVVIKDAASVLRYVEVRKAVAVVISDGDAHSVATALDTGLLRHIRECPIAIVAVQRVTQRRVRVVEVTFAAVDEVYVHPAVVVVIQESAPGPGGFRQVVVRRTAIDMPKRDAAGGRQYFLEKGMYSLVSSKVE